MLTVFWQDEEGEHEERVLRPFNRIGRSPESDLRVANPSVSRRHAVLAESGGEWTLRDLGSQNGITVGGQPVREIHIRDGGIVLLGEVELRFVLSVENAIRLEDAAEVGTDSVTREYRPGSIIMSASDVVEGRISQSAAGKVLNDEVTSALSRLADVAKSLITAPSMPAIFDRVLEAVLESTPVEHAFLLLHDETSRQLVPKAGRSRDPGKSDFAISQDIALGVFRSNGSILTLDAIDDPRFVSESIMTQGIRSVMCAPLLTHDRTLGVVFAGSTRRRVPLKEHHLHLLTVIANLAAVAIDQGNLRQQVEEELLLRSRLMRYHSPTLVDQLLADSAGKGSMPPTERDVSVLFADIVGFSTRTEHMAPPQVSRLLNGIFSELVEIIFEHQGMLDKFLGDGLMAIFGAPSDLPDHPRRAVECAMAMQRRMDELNEREGWDDPIRLRIGVNSGLAVVGDIGSERRVEYTVLGNTVNIAARLEAFVAQPGEIAIGPGTRGALDDTIPAEPLGDQTLKGFAETVPVFRVLGR